MPKKKFYVEENETIDQCLSRMAEEGYAPVRRMEEPVLRETKDGVETAYQRIVFEGRS
ncbi:NETI motif-containing protein [Alkalicoccus urumqiensis]|uniref:NETI motif-containing protein n=1 Tax=Alkalicoccus urumqiensis TaxID=1548213 RepID=A0A2P6MJ32_ALKUR|nr:NETI motif-containing protein [Alkalicoccus urumqiensis]PRO66260.1 NETI motif-containing protein [Alkalicoccus urumqiensis]